MIKVLVADDQALVREGFAMIVQTQPDLEVVARAGDGREAIEQARRWRPDVVLMDIKMPTMDGLAATAEILRELPSTRVLILTTFDPDEYVYRALRAGASGFLLKDVPPERLVDAIRVVASGDAMLDPSITRRLIERFAEQERPAPAATAEVGSLTEREREVLRLVATGATNAEIAERLRVSATTVKTHVSSVLAKLHLRDRVQAVVYAYESGLVRPGHDAPP